MDPSPPMEPSPPMDPSTPYGPLTIMDYLFLSLEGDNACHRSKDLLFDQAAVISDISDHCGKHEVSLGGGGRGEGGGGGGGGEGGGREGGGREGGGGGVGGGGGGGGRPMVMFATIA